MFFVALLNFPETIFLSATLLSSKRMKLNLYYPSHSFICIFEFLQGSKKMTLLKKVVEGNQHYGNGQKIVFDIWLTRQVENVDVYEKLLSAVTYIVEAFEVIAHKKHLEKYPYQGAQDITSQKRATACLSILVDIFFFIFDPASTKHFSIIVSKYNKMLSVVYNGALKNTFYHKSYSLKTTLHILTETSF